jgi:apolipoprotein N-acyltransferase
MMTALAHRVVLASGWSRRVIAVLCGACGALAMAPVNAVPAMAVSMCAAVWLIDGADRMGSSRSGRRRHIGPSLRAAAGAGWWWGFGYFVAGLWWLGSAFLIEADKFAWALPLGVLGLPAYLAIWPAIGFALARLLWSPGPGRILALSIGLGVSELLRGTLLTGFPWNEYGMALGGTLVLAQAASIIGIHGLTILTTLIFASPATLADSAVDNPAARGFGGAWRPVAAGGLLLVLLAGFGSWRLSAGSPGVVEGVRLRIMQPNIGQDDDFNYTNREAILKGYLALSDKATSATTSGLSDITHLIWPESPFPFILAREPDALAAIGAALPASTTLITGSARMEASPGVPQSARYYNSIQVVGHDGVITDSYDKVHLVPFGEYLPLAGLLNRLGIQQFVHVPGGFEAGDRHHLINVPGLPPVVPAICYEAIFSSQLLADLPPGKTPGVILNLTNDSWFGHTAGPYQHLDQARLRAIEEGLPLIRAATSGISAIIDPYGRIVDRLPLEVADVLDGFLPKAIAPPLFPSFGVFILVGMYGLLLTIVFVMRYRKVRPLSFDGPCSSPKKSIRVS